VGCASVLTPARLESPTLAGVSVAECRKSGGDVPSEGDREGNDEARAPLLSDTVVMDRGGQGRVGL